MNKSFRTISTILIAIGLIFLYLYLQFQSGNRLQILEQPSYYVVQNYWYVFLAGIFVILFSVLGSFFSWSKQLEKKEEILPNAGYATDEEISTWIAGSTADIRENEQPKTEVLPNSAVEKTEVLPNAEEKPLSKTEVLLQKTEILPGKTEVLPGKTEILPQNPEQNPEEDAK